MELFTRLPSRFRSPNSILTRELLGNVTCPDRTEITHHVVRMLHNILCLAIILSHLLIYKHLTKLMHQKLFRMPPWTVVGMFAANYVDDTTVPAGC